MKDKKNILFLRVDEIIEQQALGDLLADHHGKLGKLFNVSSEDIVGSDRIPEGQYTYYNSEAIHRMELQAKQGAAIDAELLDALAADEAVILKMLERPHFKKNRYRYHDLRNHLYYMHLAYWVEFIKENKITHIVYGNVPHDGYDYVIYALAKHLNLQIDMFYQLQVVDAFVHATRVGQLFTPIQQALSVIDEVALEDLSPRMQREYELRTGEFHPPYMGRRVRHGRVMDLFLEFMRNYVLRTERRRLIRREIIKPARKHAATADLTKKFIYFGLHVQPELTTNSLGGRYVNQFLAIQLISRCLPEDVHLYVKEHPNMFKTRDPCGRFREFYSMIKELKNVTIVSSNLDTFELINKSIAVATITGTLGWEAVFQGKPALVFGNSFYQFCPGVFPIFTESDMRKALEKIEHWTVGLDEARKQGLRYLKAIDNSSMNGVLNSAYIPTSFEKEEKGHSASFRKALERTILT